MYRSLLTATDTAIPLIATAIAATAILLMVTDIVALTMAAIILAIGTGVITPIVGPTMDMAAIRIVDRPTSLLSVRSTV
jgi:hypothetical protein